jgi:arginine N-succinyltransferase
LFPDDPIHTELLPDDVRSVIGQVGPETKAVEAMLRRIGFEYAGQIDPFDGGPHFVAKTDQIALVRDGREAIVRTVPSEGARQWAVVAVEQAVKPKFRAVATRVSELADGAIGIPDDARKSLGIEDGQRAWLAYG